MRKASFLFLTLLISGLVAPAAVRADRADDLYQVAAAHYAAGRWQLALDEFNALLRDLPQNARAMHALFYSGEALVQLERFDDARTRFADLLARDPQHRFARQALFRKGEAALLAGNSPAAQQDLQEFHQKYPRDAFDAYVLPYLGDIEAAADHWDSAAKHYREALDRFPAGPLADECRLGLARAIEQQGDYAAAAQRFAELTAVKKPELAERALFYLAGTYNQAGKFADSAARFEEFTQKYPDSSFQGKARLGHGWALYKLGRYEPAAPHFAALVEHPTLRVEARYWLGLTQKARQQYAAAAETLTNAAKLEPANELNGASRFHAGDAYLQEGKLDEAVAQFNIVLDSFAKSRWADDALLGKLQVALKQTNHRDIDTLAAEFVDRFPESPLVAEVGLARGTALVSLGRYQDALEPLASCRAELIDSAKQAQCRAAEVVCLAKLKRFDEAKHSYDALAQKHPESKLLAPTAHTLAEAALAAGNRELSTKLFASLAENEQPTEYSSKGLSGLGWSQLKAADLAGSAATFAQLLEKFPDDPLAPEAALARGQALEKLNQSDGALTMYRMVIDKYADSREMPQALWKAARLHDRLEQEQQAIELYRTLVEKHAEFTDLDAALYHWAWAEHDLNHAAECESVFTRLHQNYPISRYWADATYRLAERALIDKRFDETQRLLEKLLESSTDAGMQTHGLYLQGRLAIARGAWADLQQPLERLVTEHPESPLAFSSEYWLAEARYRLGEYEAAAERFALLAEKCPGRPEKWLGMAPLRQAQSLAQLGQWRDAMTIARKIAADYPDFEQGYEADYVIGRALASQADFTAAREAYLKVIRSAQGGKTETAAMAQWMVGESYFHQENYELALREYLRVEILYTYPPWQAGALLQAGKCHEELNEWKQAAELYERVINVYPDTEFTTEARQRLSTAQQHAGSQLK